MRRKEREVTDKAALESIIKETFYASLAMHTGEAPYLLPLNFGYTDGAIYMHSAREGQKLNVLRAAGGSVPASAMFIAKASLLDKGKPSACNLSARYASVIATGTLTEVTAPAERLHGLRCIAAQVGVAERPFDDGELGAVVVLKLTIATMVGKMNDPV